MRTASSACLTAAAAWLLYALATGGIAWTPAFLAAAAGCALLWARSAGRPWERAPAAFCALSALAVYLSTFRCHGGGDDITNSLLPIAALRYHTFAMNQVMSPFLDGKAHDFIVDSGAYRLAFHPIFSGMLVIPLYVVPVLARAPVTEVFLHNMSKLSASVLVAASVAAFYRAAEARASRPWALATTLVYAFGTFSLSVSSQALFQHAATQLGAALGFWGLATRRRWSPWLAGLGFGLAVAARGDSALFAAAAGVYLLLRRPRAIAAFIGGAALPMAVIASYWLHYTGRLAEPGTSRQLEAFGPFLPSAFWALAASPTRGLLFFSPVALFGAAALASKEPDERALAWPFLAACVVYWIAISHFKNWTAGMTFGPRYFSMTAAVLMLLCVGAEPWLRAKSWRMSAWCAAAAFSICVHASGAYLTWPGSYNLNEQMARAWDPGLHPLANLLSSSGALGGLPAIGRGAVFVLVLAAGAALARGLRRVVQ